MVVSSGDYHGGNWLCGCVFAYQYIGYSGYDGRCVGGAGQVAHGAAPSGVG